MLRNGWNFHNDVAIPLEQIARSQLNFPNRPYDTIYDADSIESGNFVRVMFYLLDNKSQGITNSKIDDFIQRAKGFYGVNSHEINPETADKLMREFRELHSTI